MDSKDSISLILKCAKNSIDLNEYEDEILKPYTYLNKNKRKIVISMFNVFNHWFDIPEDKKETVKEISEYLTQLLMLIDDIIDDAKPTSRMSPSHVIYGFPATFICCEYANYKLLENISQSNNADALKNFIDYGLCGNYGQAVEVYWRDHFICPTLLEYFMMLKGKAGGYLKYITKIIQSYSKNSTNYDEIMDLFGFYGQCFNDYRNLFKSENENTGEIFADDLTEGKFSFPLVHAISVLKNQEVSGILKQRPTNLETKRKCVKILKDIGTQKYCHEVIRELGNILLKKIQEAGGNPPLEEIIVISSYLYKP